MRRQKIVPSRGSVQALSVWILFLLLSSCMPGSQELPSPDLLAQHIHDKDYPALEKDLQQFEVDSPQYLIDFIKEGDASSWERTSVEYTLIEANGHSQYSLLLLKANHWRRYLVFRSSNKEQWKFFGRVDLTDHLQDTTHRMVTDSQGNAWLVLRSVMGHGTGVFSYGESWYSLNGKEMKEALTYAVYSSAAGTSPEFPTTVVIKGDAYSYYVAYDKTFNIEVSSEATYMDHQGHFLFRIERTKYYVWSPAANRFFQDMERPVHIQQEAAREFPYARDEFLPDAYDELLELAKNGDPVQKQWLEQLLSTTEESLEKEDLLKALNSQ